MKFQGEVTRQLWAEGSKSEHRAVVLKTADGVFKLRRRDGNPFRDEVLEDLVGREIACEGEVHSGQLFMTEWRNVAPEKVCG